MALYSVDDVHNVVLLFPAILLDLDKSLPSQRLALCGSTVVQGSEVTMGNKRCGGQVQHKSLLSI